MKKKTLGIILIVVPPTLLVLSLIGYAVASFVISSLMMSTPDPGSVFTTAQIVRLILGLMGTIGLVGIPIGIIVGAILITRPEPESTPQN